jgi:hypothetical protein
MRYTRSYAQAALLQLATQPPQLPHSVSTPNPEIPEVPVLFSVASISVPSVPVISRRVSIPRVAKPLHRRGLPIPGLKEKNKRDIELPFVCNVLHWLVLAFLLTLSVHSGMLQDLLFIVGKELRKLVVITLG